MSRRRSIRLRDAGVDNLIVYVVDREGAAMLRSMERIGYRPNMISAWGLNNSFGKAVGPLADGILVAGTFNWNGELSPRPGRFSPISRGNFRKSKRPATSKCLRVWRTLMTAFTSLPRV